MSVSRSLAEEGGGGERGGGEGGGGDKGVGGNRKQQEKLMKNYKRISLHGIFFSLHGGRSFVFDLCRSC